MVKYLEIVKIKYHEIDQYIADKAYRIMRECGLIVLGTDTVYGLATTPYLDECVDKLFKAKRRPYEKPIPILASSLKAVLEIADVNKGMHKFLQMIWPGPVTIVLRVREKVFSDLVAPGDYVGFRVPATPMVRLLAGMNGGFITGTSANLSGAKPPCIIDEAIRQLGGTADLYIDMGRSPICKPSTVIRLGDGGFEVIREGAVSRDTIDYIYTISTKG